MRILAVGDRDVRSVEEVHDLTTRINPAEGIPLVVQLQDGRARRMIIGSVRHR
jgi:hypothetical protein